METATLNKKLDEHKRPIQLITVGGIILAVITFFVLVYLILHILFTFLVGLFGHLHLSEAFKANGGANGGANSANVLNGSNTGAVGVPAGRVYAQPLNNNYIHAGRVYAE